MNDLLILLLIVLVLTVFTFAGLFMYLFLRYICDEYGHENEKSEEPENEE